MGRPEDERVKIPALIHLTRLEYDYLSLKTNDYDGDTNIFIDVFRVAVSRLNGKDFSEQEIKAVIQEFKLMLDADDLGRSFYNHLLKATSKNQEGKQTRKSSLGKKQERSE